jgi:hypothetical protein
VTTFWNHHRIQNDEIKIDPIVPRQQVDGSASPTDLYGNDESLYRGAM